MRLISVASFKTLMEQTTSNFDTLFALLIDAYSRQFEAYLNRKLEATARTVKFRGGGSKYQLPAFPIDETPELLVIVEDGTTLVKDEDFFIDFETGELEFERTITQRIKRPLSVTWTGGYAVLEVEDTLNVLASPETIRSAMYMQCNYLFRRRDKLGLESVDLGNMGQMQIQGHMGLIPEVRRMLESERRLPDYK